MSGPVPGHQLRGAGVRPQFSVSTSAKTSRTNGASLHVKLAYPTAPFGSQANISRVAVDLPKQLPSRLKTLQKACSAAQFEANPAGCPAASVVGHAKATTPLLPVALEGPAYFVSHGGEAFPSLIIALQGYGVTVDLIGTTVHQQTQCHEHHVQDGSRRARRRLRTNAPRGPLLRAHNRRKNQSLQVEARDAHHLPRAERGRTTPEHDDHRDRLPEEEANQAYPDNQTDNQNQEETPEVGSKYHKPARRP